MTLYCLLTVLQSGNPTSYSQINATVPILRLYFDGESDLCPDLHLIRASILHLITAVPYEVQQGWSKEIEVLLFISGWPMLHPTEWLLQPLTSLGPKSTGLCTRSAVLGLFRKVVRLPQSEELEVLGAGFARLAASPVFSVADRAIDGGHIHMKLPSVNTACYFNRKLFFSVQFQAVCDHQVKFLHACIGFPGSVHNAGVLKHDAIYCKQLYPSEGRFVLKAANL